MSEIEKDISTTPIDVEVGTAADVEEIMKKFDRESNTRIWEGLPKTIIRFMLAFFSVYLIYSSYMTVDERIRRSVFLGFIVLFVFILYPLRPKDVRPNHIPLYDIALGIIGAGCFFNYTINLEPIINMGNRIGNLEVVLGIIGILILAECCRRVVGIPILCVASAFILYAYLPFFADKTVKQIVYQLFYTTNGVMGTPIEVCSTFIVLFIIFGAFLEATGIANFFIDCANSIAGSATGGPAKVAVISSALCGMVSGSSVGNTVTTGAITIPLMKKTGYPGEFAGAVEAASSTGGQIMPPIMGAAAFLMVQFTGFQYSDILVRAILPAFLYFSGIFLMVHFMAKKLGLKGLNKEDLPKFKAIIKKIYLIAPLVALVYMILEGRTMASSAVTATAIAIVVSFFDKEHRMTPSTFVSALETGAKNSLSVGIACGIAGIIAGVVTMTGLGQLLISGIVGVSSVVSNPAAQLFIALFLTMLCCIVLGMGVPTTANYIIMATTCAPILITGMGMEVLAAHMFVFYFGIVADITPPVALAAYAGSAIAKSNPMKTAFNATRLAIAAFLIPYIFAYNPTMLFIGDVHVFDVVLVIITSFLGMVMIAGGLIGFMLRNLTMPIRALSVAAGLMLIIPGVVTDVIGISIFVALIVVQVALNKKDAAIA